uniref:Putative secreted protein n=1 Tax=Anopheles darlingi TaxID=43151 RepID=A0A2M4DE27_ANODA
MTASLLLLLPAELLCRLWPLRFRRAYSAFLRLRSIHCSGDSFSNRSFALAAFFANRAALCSAVSFARDTRIRSASFANRTARCSGVSMARRIRSLAALRA